MLVFFALGNAKVLSFALADAKVPNASSFAFWWNIGFRNNSQIILIMAMYIIVHTSWQSMLVWEVFPYNYNNQ